MHCKYCNGPTKDVGVIEVGPKRVQVLFCKPCNRVGSDVPMEHWPTRTDEGPGWQAQWRVLVESALVQQERLRRFLAGDEDVEMGVSTVTHGG
jgi:hypothetical protein